ncbi:MULTISPECIES: DUF302 domain-containing protein [Paracoccus]|uniref:DUF302 domain-containing protein n=1 Tax=Paracoccus TaxID=265 RepID=UPI0003B3E4F3|nr:MULTISPECIES: DUF302 domain-containing protein [Paracoccus]
MRLPMIATAMTLMAAPALADDGPDDWIVKDSPHDVVTTADRLEAAIEESPAKLVTRIDHQRAAEAAGLEMPGATVMIFGNPEIGTPLMNADPRIALDLPARVLIWDEDGQTKVGYMDPEEFEDLYEIDGAEEPLEKLAGAMGMLTDKAIAE